MKKTLALLLTALLLAGLAGCGLLPAPSADASSGLAEPASAPASEAGPTLEIISGDTSVPEPEPAEELDYDTQKLDALVGTLYSLLNRYVGYGYEFDGTSYPPMDLEAALKGFDSDADLQRSIFFFCHVMAPMGDDSLISQAALKQYSERLFGVDATATQYAKSQEDPANPGYYPEVPGFGVEGGPYPGNISWERGEDNLLSGTYDVNVFDIDVGDSYYGNFTITFQLMEDEADGTVYPRFVRCVQNS